MRALIQRVTEASVRVGDDITGAIGPGLLVFVGVTHTDDESAARRLAERVWTLRVFPDSEAPMHLSAADLGREVLVVSQFTLYGDTTRGRRPSWSAAARPEVAEPLIDEMVRALRTLGATVATGRFRASMAVSLVNDGPVTVMVET